jgi:hypothetical protein
MKLFETDCIYFVWASLSRVCLVVGRTIKTRAANIKTEVMVASL